MTLLDTSDDALRAVIRDMREQATTKRAQSRGLHAANKHDRAFAILGEAIVIEHWANRLETLLNSQSNQVPPSEC